MGVFVVWICTVVRGEKLLSDVRGNGKNFGDDGCCLDMPLYLMGRLLHKHMVNKEETYIL
jgi:hypothetical protein